MKPDSVPVVVYWTSPGAVEEAVGSHVLLYPQDGSGPEWKVAFEFTSPPSESDNPSVARLRTLSREAPTDYLRRGRVLCFYARRRRRLAHVVVVEGFHDRDHWPSFPITVRWERGKTVVYESFRPLELDAVWLDIDNRGTMASVTDARGRRVHLLGQVLAVYEFRLADEP